MDLERRRRRHGHCNGPARGRRRVLRRVDQGSALTQFGTFANALQASGPLAVWHRPTTSGGSDGNSYGVISNKVTDKAAFLSSRRD